MSGTTPELPSRFRHLFSGLEEVVRYRHMILGLVKRDLRGRYKGSFAGFLWNYITPVVQILVYILVFSEILKAGIENYYAYLLSGLVPWIFFSEALMDGSGSLLANGEMVKKLYFPRAVIPMAIVISKFVTFSITFSMALIIMFLFDFPLNTSIVVLPVAMVLLAIFALGMAMLLAPLNVLFRDVQHIVNVLLMAWVWLTPVMYLSDFIENQIAREIIRNNPMTYYVEQFQSIVYHGTIPVLDTWLFLFAMSIAMLFLGYVVIKKLQGRIAEEL